MRAAFFSVFLVVGFACSGLGAFDVRKIPDAQDLAVIAQKGWAASAEELESQLASVWKPSHVAQVGSGADDNFRRWLLLYRWCRLLGTPEPDALRAYLGRRVLEDPSREHALLIVPPGLALPTDNTGRPLPTAADKLADARVPAEILQALLPDDYTPQSGPVALRAKQDFLLQLAGDQDFLREFFRTLTPDDFPPVALTRLEQLYTAHPHRWGAYRSLMLAYALVYDQRKPAFWPHHQVDPSDVIPMDEPLPERFAYYARLNDAGRLDFDLRRMSAAELKFVVDAPVPRSELEWAAKNVHARRDKFEEAFSAVNYDQRRAQRGVFVWPHGRYLLPNIEVWSGICVDQAYFACIAGKARGIPTIFFAGQGTDGGHAWFGFWRGNSQWELDGGRYLNQNYTVGKALDPQTWLPITDHELLYLSGRASHAPGQDAALADLVMAGIFAFNGDSASRLAAAESALNNAPGLVAAWEEREQALEAAADTAALRAHYTQAIDYFRREEDLRVRYQARLAELERAAGDAGTARKLEDRMVRENRRERADLSVAAEGETLGRLLAAADYEGAMREFRTAAGKLGRTGGGNFFYGVVRPFVLQLRSAGRDKDAEKALQIARRAMAFEADSIIAREFIALERGESPRRQ